MKVLVVKTSSMGDVIHALPALTDAAKAVPDIRFDWLVEQGFSEIPAWHGLVNKVIPVTLRKWKKKPIAAIKTGEFSALRQRLKEEHYDLIIDAQGLIKSAMMARFSVGLRCGMDWRSAREPLASCLYQRRYRVARNQHAITRIRQLFALSLGYAVPEGAPDYGLNHSRFAVKNDSTDYMVFLHGTSRDNKCWDENNWRGLAQVIGEAGYGAKLLWGSEEERKRAERIAQDNENVEVMSRLSLTEIASTLIGAKAVVAVDTGLGHLSCALSVPTVSLYGPTDPTLIGTMGPSQIYLPLSAGDQDVWDGAKLLIRVGNYQ